MAVGCMVLGLRVSGFLVFGLRVLASRVWGPTFQHCFELVLGPSDFWQEGWASTGFLADKVLLTNSLTH